MTEREGISWLWIAGRVGICWLWSARRFQNLEVIIPFSLCDPCPCLLCTPVPYSRASLAKINTLLRLLPSPPCRKCLLAQEYEWLCCLVGKGDKGLLWGHYPIPPAFSGSGVKFAKLGPGFLPESCLLPPVLGSSAGNVVKMLRLLSALWVFGMLGLLPSELDRHKSPEDGLYVGIDVSLVLEFSVGAPEMLGSPPREWPVGLMPTVLSEVTRDTWSGSRCSELSWNTSMM